MKNIPYKKTCFGIFAGVSFIGFIGLTLALVLTVGAGLFLCMGITEVLDAVTKSIDDQPLGVGFFEETAGWDYSRIALVEPYHAISTNKKTWGIDLKTGSLRYQSSAGATKLDIIDNRYIITYAQDDLLEGERYNEVWFVIIPDQKIENGFTNEEEFLAYLEEHDIPAPNLRDVNELYKELRSKGYLEWFPEEYKE